MNKKVLIISPYFPPSNAADMQRVRMSLPYFKQFGWDAEVVAVSAGYSEMLKDNLLTQSIPSSIKVHEVKAFSKKWTSKFGIGSLAFRSIWFYRQKVNGLLKKGKYDLVYFSTTQFPVCILGAYWKKRFGIPYVIDMQDPWHSDYYLDKPKDQRPRKYWFSYRVNKYLEPIAVRNADGLISVSESYIADLKTRYPGIKNMPAATITFGAFLADLEIAKKNRHLFAPLLDPSFTNIVYIGRGGRDMHTAITPLFKALKDGLVEQPDLLNRLKIYFIGTSYAPAGQGRQTIIPLARQFDIENHIVEHTERISYYHTLVTLQEADALFVPGSDDPNYTASKIYPYLLTGKPLMAVFSNKSSVVEIVLTHTRNANLYSFLSSGKLQKNDLSKVLYDWANGDFTPVVLLDSFKEYSAENLTKKQTELFLLSLDYFRGENENK